ncbi:MAG: DUF3854 domain-containing protein [Myxacorys californica WJT36-NPBG1]|nr:DUF3854 domain-containing protein [Myxacorys californica WJT36-NPBG1]
MTIAILNTVETDTPSNSPSTPGCAQTDLVWSKKIEQEFITGSGIDPDLFATAVRLVADTEVLPGGEVAYPIHEALNWRMTRFGDRARTTLWAALLVNQDGSTWQAKLNCPRQTIKRDRHGSPQRDDQGHPLVKPIKYESVVGIGSQAYLPAIPASIRSKIAQRYGIEVPQSGDFWQWLALHPEIPIIWTEGGKKALCLLSLGYVAIALYGVHGGYRTKDTLGHSISPALIPDVARFAVPGRPAILAFDQDTKAETRSTVSKALIRFGGLLTKAGSEVKIAQWPSQQGKGIDDLRVVQGVDAVQQAIEQAMVIEQWRIRQWLEHRLTWRAAMHLRTADLSTLHLPDLPQQGLIAIASPKATGKTKFIGQQVAGLDKVLSATHRVALGRNLSSRLGLDWRGDLDKTPDGRFITGSGYTLRVGFCVDSLLAINPDQFRGCDLIIDEVCQVLRHLLTSATTNQDGKRPALLARLRALLQAARRVIVADADLDNATLHCLRDLRGDDQPLFLVRNDYGGQGYPVRFLQASDRTAIAADLSSAVQALPAGKVILVATDSKQVSKTLARLMAQQYPQKRVLTINAETSGGSLEREFIETPNQILGQGLYDIILASPSLATGVSIEAKGIIASVYGIFTGGSATDADMAQALGRVREPVERVVWCAQRGSNFSKISRSTNTLELKSHLQQRTSAVVGLVRSSLREDVWGEISNCDWQADPWVNLFCRQEAERNRSMLTLRDSLHMRLQHEGNRVVLEDRTVDPAARLLLQQMRDELKQSEADAIVGAGDLTDAQVLVLEQKEHLTPDEQRSLSKFHLKEFYGWDTLWVEDVLWDNGGRRRAEVLSLEAQLFPTVATDRTVKALEKQASWNQGLCPWDISGVELRRKLRELLGLNQFLDPDREWTKHDLAECAAHIRAQAPLVRQVLNFSVTERVSDVQLVHQLLSQLGLKIAFRWCRGVPGSEGEKLRVYRLEPQHWQALMEVLRQRQSRRQNDLPAVGSPVPEIDKHQTGDPSPSQRLAPEKWLSPAPLAAITPRWRLADSEDSQAAS